MQAHGDNKFSATLAQLAAEIKAGAKPKWAKDVGQKLALVHLEDGRRVYVRHNAALAKLLRANGCTDL